MKIEKNEELKKMKTFTYALMLLIFVLIYGYIESHNPKVGRLHLIRYEDALSTLKTGDMIFTKSKNWTSKVQQYFFGSFINHCAMVFRADDDSLWIWDLAPQVGAYMTPLKEFIKNNWYGKPPNPYSPPIGINIPYVVPRSSSARFTTETRSSLYIRRLHYPLNQQKVLEFIQKNIGRPYSWRFWLSAYVHVSGLEFPLGWSIAKDTLGMFCSELIAHTYIHAGALHPLLSAPPSLLPVHFWENNLHWIHGQGLLPPEQIVGNVNDQETHAGSTIAWEKGISLESEVIDTLVNLLHKETNGE